jgi:hypothetical protein
MWLTQGRPAIAARPDVGAPRGPVIAAKEWWQAFGTAKLSSLAPKTALPFRFATTMDDKDKACEGPASGTKELEAWLRCMKRSHKLLLKVAKKVKDIDIHIVDSKEDESQVGVLGDLLPKVSGDEKLVYTYLDGGPVIFLFVLSIGGGPNPLVHDFMMSAEENEGR